MTIPPTISGAGPAGPAAAPPGPARRADAVALAACVAVGLLMATLPYLLWWRILGEPVYISDNDDLTVYMPLGSQAYYEHPAHLGDPIRPRGGPAFYPWLQLVPGILVAKALGTGPLSINLIWRLWAGLSIPLAWYFVVRRYAQRPAVAAALVIFLMSDVGLVFGTLLIRQALVAARVLSGTAAVELGSFTKIHYGWRIVTPGLSLAYLLLYIGLLDRARAAATRPRIAAAGLAFGLLFYDYFYFWTAAGLGLALALVLDARHRKVYFWAGALGGLVGLPAILANMALKASSSPDFGPRLDLFLPIARFSEFQVPLPAAALLVACLAWTWARRWDLIYLWCLAASGLFLMNGQVLTGLQIQNFHWLYALGPALSLLAVLLVQGEVARARAWPRGATRALLVAAGLYLGVGLWLRGVEALRTRETREILASYERYRAQRLRPGAPALAPGSVLAGRQDFVNLAIILERQVPLSHNEVNHSPATSNEEWDARIALNAYLLGLTRPAFEAGESALLRGGGWGPWGRHEADQDRRLASRLARYDADAADPPAALDRYHVRYFASEPGRLPAGPGWTRLQRGPTWDLWERTPRDPGRVGGPP